MFRRYFTKLLTLIPSNDKADFTVDDKIDDLVKKYQDKQKKLIEKVGGISAMLKKEIVTV